ncbi:MAG: HAMP domain-containing histidine kinase [Elusimicrobia bacterium]|nr:HAMP domain-containing histidine kinase [Elusimicrobiota bacterium]
MRDERETREAQAEELLSVVAHDLRNPLSCIQGYAEMLMSRELPAAEKQNLLGRILSCSRFAEQILEDLMDSTAIERGSFKTKPTRVLMTGLLRQAVETMEHTASARDVQLSLRGPEVDYPVQADPKRILQVVQNLVSNAIRHVDTGTGKVEVTLHDLDGELVVEVSDNGLGIAPEDVHAIFEKFVSLGDDRSRGSLGLGLFIARKIMELHGGRLWARSQGLGKGASFYFSLPKYDPDLAFRRYKDQRGMVTPPPRDLRAAPAGKPQPALAVAQAGPVAAPAARRPLGKRVIFQAALIATLVGAHLALARWLPRPSAVSGSLATSGPIR